MKIVNYSIISAIKLYQFFISPFFLSNCRYQPTCSEYFIDCIKLHGIKGFYFGIKRLARCHPIKILGAKSGFDPVPKLEKREK
jgi:putative membrane protein insertion efficiency factor